MNLLYWILVIVFYIPLYIIFPTKIVGKNNIPKGKAILICNHQSVLDPVILLLRIRYQPKFMAKQELFNNKFVAFICKTFNAIPVNRENVGTSTIKSSLKILNENKQLIIFPEGTRKKISLDESEALKNGSAYLSIKGDCPIVPMYFTKKPGFLVFNKLIIGKPIVEQTNIKNIPLKQQIEIYGEEIKNSMMELKSRC